MSPLEREAREAFDWLFIGDEVDLARRRGEPAPIVPTTPRRRRVLALLKKLGVRSA